MRRALLLLLPAAALAEDLPKEVTFSEHIAPLVFEHCAECHREGEPTPFPLLTYADVRKRAAMLNHVIQRRYMPPWHPVPGHGEFKNERRLTDRELELFDRWARTGAKRGDPARAPPRPEFPGGWRMGEPDAVLAMPEPFEVPADGPDIYRNFVLPHDLDEDKWVQAVAFQPSGSVIHHCFFFHDRTGRARRMDAAEEGPGFPLMLSKSGRLGAWAVGSSVHHFPPGLAVPLPRDSDFVLAAHFTPSGKREREQGKVGLYFASRPPERRLRIVKVPPEYGAFSNIDIPPGERSYVVFDRLFLPVDTELFSIAAHAHYLCRRVAASARLPDGGRERLLLIAAWEFDWHEWYEFKEPVKLPAGSWIEVELTYDNSADNPSNPHHPPRRVRWGLQTTDEMGTVFLSLASRRGDDARLVESLDRAKSMWRVRRGLVRRRLLEHDRNGDGVVDKDEFPAADRSFLARLDRNGNGRVEPAEFDAFELGE